ncbi:UNVERIFIED_CONTAM: SNF1-interacting protein [Siphonaria sp. JEL0065]|nr:SNF1-interacting protein [Siphonaria sp. JEL0065]
MNDHSLNLVASFTSHRRLSILGDTSVLDSFADALKTVCSLNAQMAEDLTENLVFPLQHYLREEIKELREHRKNHDRVTTNYDVALTKYSQLPKNKESSALHEDSFILFEAKKAYIHSNLNYADHVISFKNKMIYFFVQQLMLGMYTHMDYFENNYEVFHGMKGSMDMLKIRIEERKRALPSQEEILSYKNALEEEALSIARPRLDDQKGSTANSAGVTPPSKTSSTGSKTPSSKDSGPGPLSSLTLPAAALPAQQSLEIEGYLFKRNEKKVWIRRYFMIKKGTFFYANTYPTGKLRGVVLSTDSLSLANYSIRPDTVEDRRFCFEVYGAKRSYKLQAESERDMMDWINVFDAAKAALLKPPTSVAILAPPDSNPNSSVASPASFSSGPTVLQNQQVPLTASPPAPSTLVSDGEDGLVLHEVNNTQSDEEEDVDDVDFQEEVGGDSVVEESGKAVALFEDVEVTYPDKVSEAKNKELHKILKSVPSTDYVIDSFAIFLQRANLIQGKVYVTQNRICFYSNIMGIISVLVIHLKEIRTITRAKHGLYKCINIETTKAPHQFKTFMKDDGRTHAVIQGAFENSQRVTGRLNAQDLFDKLSATSKKLEEKEEEKAKAAAVGDNDDGASIAPADGEAGEGTRCTEFDLPEGTAPPATNPSCECADHLEHKDEEFTLPIPAKRAFEIMFGASAETKARWAKFFVSRGETTVLSENWVEPATGVIMGEAPPGAISSKVLNYTMPVNAPMVKVKEAGVESILYLTKKVDYFVYVIEKRSSTPALPYSDSFVPIVKYCITWVGKNSCKVMMSTGVKFYKNPMVKGIIRQQAMSGSEQFSKDLARALREEVNGIVAKENPKKAGAVGVESTTAIADGSGGAGIQSSGSAQGEKVESVLPFGLSHSFMWQWGIVGLLGLSLLLNIISVFRGSGRTTPPAQQQTITIRESTSSCQAPHAGSLDWRSEISTSRKLGVMSEKSILGYLASHYPEWNPESCNSSIISPYRASTHRISHFPPPLYHQGQMKAVYARLHAIHEAASEARNEALNSLKWLDELERDVFWAGYWNWIADSVVVNEASNKCRELPGGVSQYVGGCEKIQAVLAELEMRTFK